LSFTSFCRPSTSATCSVAFCGKRGKTCALHTQSRLHSPIPVVQLLVPAPFSVVLAPTSPVEVLHRTQNRTPSLRTPLLRGHPSNKDPFVSPQFLNGHLTIKVTASLPKEQFVTRNFRPRNKDTSLGPSAPLVSRIKGFHCHTISGVEKKRVRRGREKCTAVCVCISDRYR
jgi:hypothetical protein